MSATISRKRESPGAKWKRKRNPSLRSAGHCTAICADERLHAELRHERDQCEDAHDRDDVEHRRRHGGQEEAPVRVQHPHARRGHRDQREEGEHHLGEPGRELELARYGGVAGRDQPGERSGQQHAGKRDGTGDDQEAADDDPAQLPRGRPASLLQLARERRDERGAHGPLGEEVPDEVGQAERDVVRVHVIAGAESDEQDLVAQQPEHAAAHRCRADKAGRPRETGA
jgi:hypothetical protein